MASTDERNARRGRMRPARRPRTEATLGRDWVWGRHAVEAALAHPPRGSHKLLSTDARGRELAPILVARAHGDDLDLRTVTADLIARELPTGAAHQGCALLVEPLVEPDLLDLADDAHGVLVVLDQVTDPQNVGAVVRSAAAFGARGVVVQDRHAPALSGVVAKAAAGAIETVPVMRVVNLARALDQLADRGWRAVGLAGDAEASLEEALDSRPVVLVLGSEGEGLRRLVSEHCDVLARIAMPGGFQSLNVSAAAAVALYAARRPR